MKTKNITAIIIAVAIFIIVVLILGQMFSKNMITYANKNNNFKINYPKDWTYNEGQEFNYAFHVFFSKGTAQFGVLPKGEVDRGLQLGEPIKKEIIINNQKAIRKDWTLDNGNFLIIINFLDYPATWNENNRLDITGEQKDVKIFEKMIKSFKFELN